MGAKELAERWLRAARDLREQDRLCVERLSVMAKRHTSEAFYALSDPLEAALLSVLVELLKEMDRDVDP
jgi:hypothetical protein